MNHRLTNAEQFSDVFKMFEITDFIVLRNTENLDESIVKVFLRYTDSLSQCRALTIVNTKVQMKNIWIKKFLDCFPRLESLLIHVDDLSFINSEVLCGRKLNELRISCPSINCNTVTKLNDNFLKKVVSNCISFSVGNRYLSTKLTSFSIQGVFNLVKKVLKMEKSSQKINWFLGEIEVKSIRKSHDQLLKHNKIQVNVDEYCALFEGNRPLYCEVTIPSQPNFTIGFNLFEKRS